MGYNDYSFLNQRTIRLNEWFFDYLTKILQQT